ncbi:hypothetical protein MMC29_004722 [Sticta canariensis]|nr:hypothetical protein [Sticta canariensis]
MNNNVLVMRGNEDTGYESPVPKAPCLFLATPAPTITHTEKWQASQRQGKKVPREKSRHRRQKKEQRRRNTAHPRLCHLTKLPNELLLKVMHHMDKDILKTFVLTSKRMHHVREANTIAVFKGMQREQFCRNLSVFGDPNERSDEQVEEMQTAARKFDWWRNAPRSRYQDLRSIWWQHFTNLAIIEENLDAETISLRNLASGDEFNAALSKDAMLLQWRLGLNMVQITEDDGQQQVQILLNYPAEVQHQFLKMIKLLGAKIEEKVGLAAIAGCWARFEVHLPEVGSFEETRFVEWTSVRVTAHTLAIIFRCGPRKIAELLKYPKDSANVSQMRFDFVERLVNDQAQAGEGEFNRGMMMARTTGFHALIFAKTKQRVKSLLDFWRCQSADSHMIHFKRFVGIEE